MQLKRKRNQGDRIRFNGTDLSSLVYCKVQRPVMAPVSASFGSVSGRHGEVFESALLEGYDLPVEMWVRAEHRREVAEVRHRLAAALWTDEPAPLYLPDDPTRYLLAVVSGSTDLGEICDESPTATVNFHVGDPVYYGVKRRMEVSAGDVYLNAGGTWPARLYVTAWPDGDGSWKIANADTGEFVEISSGLSSTATIRLDMETERATVNQQTAAVTIDSDFFEVEGRCHLTLSGGTALLEWNERWL